MNFSSPHAVKAAMRSSFAKGVGSIVSIRGCYIAEPRLKSASDDRRALAADWLRVGNDLRTAAWKTKSSL